MADAVVGVLRALLTADTAQFDTSMRKAAKTTEALGVSVDKTGDEIKKLTPQAERMVKAFAGDKLLYQANNLVAAVQKVGGAAKLTEAEQGRVNTRLNEAIEKYRLFGQEAPQAMIALRNATKSTQTPTEFLTTKMIALGSAVGNFVGNLAAQGLRSLIAFGREAFDSAGNILDLSNKTGLGTATIQRMQFVADQTSTSLESMTEAAFRLGVRISGGGNSVQGAVRDLGLEFVKLRQMRPDQMWETVISALSKVENATERNRIGVELFGRSFSTIAASVAQGYDEMASQAQVSSDAQLEALDRAADRWSQFVTNTQSNVRTFVGNALLMADAIRAVIAERGVLTSTAGVLAEADRRVRLGLMGAKTKDIELTEAGAKAEETYAQQLVKVQAELNALTAAQRREIEAAQQLGVSTDDLETKYGLTEGALRLLNSQTKDYEKNLKTSTEATEKAAKARRDFLNFVGEREMENAAAALRAQEDALKDQRQLTNQIEEQRIKDHERALTEQATLDREYRAFTNELGMREVQAEQERQEQLARLREAMIERWQMRVDAVTFAITDGFGAMLVGARGFKDGFLDIWRDIQQNLARIFSDILADFIHRFLGGMVRGIAGARLGQALGNALSGGAVGAALGGGAAALPAALAAENAALGAGAAAGGGIGSTLGALATNPVTWAVAGGAALAWAIGKKSLFRGGEEALQVNPKRDQFLAQFGGPGTGPNSGFANLAARLTQLTGQFGGGALFRSLTRADSLKEFRSAEQAIVTALRDRNIKQFNFGGFVPAGEVQLATLHGPEWVIPDRQLQQFLQRPNPQAQRQVNVTFMIHAFDGADVHRVVREKVAPTLKQMLFFNTDGFGSAVQGTVKS